VSDFSSDVSQPDRGDALSLTLECLNAIRLYSIADDPGWTTGLQARESYAFAAVLLAVTSRRTKLTLYSRFVRVLCRPEPVEDSRHSHHGYLDDYSGEPSRPYLMRVMQESSQHLDSLIIRIYTRSWLEEWELRNLDLRLYNAVKHLEILLAAISITRIIQTKYPPNVESVRLSDFENRMIDGARIRDLIFKPRHALPLLRKMECEASNIGTCEADMHKFMREVYVRANEVGVELHWAQKGR
jgi:hypothetical protein